MASRSFKRSQVAENGHSVIIAVLGVPTPLARFLSTTLFSMVAALTPLPVIGVPVRASALDGLDSLLSIVQMPRGVPRCNGCLKKQVEQPV
ncbi:phosphoribosylaminoimidazole carboxylase, chloroplastic-like protein [Tanacetum coccineum]|uniref:phosphoribosylaminoimidazole carboxylase n=1 Tax=Tanacetum coccineum TaxID=301880 RepID=A0ABQ5IF71_9ASTR